MARSRTSRPGGNTSRTLPAAAQAAAIRKVATTYGLALTANITRDYNAATGEWDGKAIDATITAEATFKPGDKTAYMLAESRCNEVLRYFKMVRPGTRWGTTSDGVGGADGLAEGVCRLHLSGAEMRLARQFAA
jgi:hypothetical protein